MDRELYLLRIVIQADYLFYRIKLSREEIEEKHPHREDILKAMREAERIALESAEFMRMARDEIAIHHQTLASLQIASIKLEAENRELRQKNASLLDKINL